MITHVSNYANIETPILDSKNHADLPEVPWTPDVRRYLSNLVATPIQ